MQSLKDSVLSYKRVNFINSAMDYNRQELTQEQIDFMLRFIDMLYLGNEEMKKPLPVS